MEMRMLFLTHTHTARFIYNVLFFANCVGAEQLSVFRHCYVAALCRIASPTITAHATAALSDSADDMSGILTF
jgi:hypothetical protein